MKLITVSDLNNLTPGTFYVALGGMETPSYIELIGADNLSHNVAHDDTVENVDLEAMQVDRWDKKGQFYQVEPDTEAYDQCCALQALIALGEEKAYQPNLTEIVRALVGGEP